MRIVHVLPVLSKGGGERVAADLANAAAAAGHQVTIIGAYPVDRSLLCNSLDPAVDVRYVTTRPSRFWRYAAAVLWVRRHRRWLAEQDILHAHMTYGTVFASLVARLKRRPALVETVHSVGMPVPVSSRARHARLVARREALVLMAEDDFWPRVAAARTGLVNAVIPNGVAAPDGPSPQAERDAYRAAAGIPAEARFVVGAVGQLRPERRPSELIIIFAHIAEALGEDVHFLIAGEGSERERLTALITEHGLDGRVHMPGVAPSARLPSSVIDLYITQNVGPITGIAALEAAFVGAPIIAVQRLGDYEAAPQDWIWSSRDLAAIAARAVTLLQDPARRAELARAQNDYVKGRHSVGAMAKAYEEVYQRAAELMTR